MVFAHLPGLRDNVSPLCGVGSPQICRNGLSKLSGCQVRVGNHRPDLRLIDLGGKLVRTVEVTDVVQQHLDGLRLEAKLAVYLIRLLVQVVPDGNLTDGRPVKVVQAEDVVLDAGPVRLDGSDDEQILQIVVVGEGCVVQHDLFQELDELGLQLGGHEGLHRDGHLLRVLALWERSGHHLVDELPPVSVLLAQNLLPESHVLPVNDVTCLKLEHCVLGGALDQFIVTLPPLIRNAREARVPLLRKFAHDARLIVGIRCKEVLGIAVRVDEDFAQRVVDLGLAASL
mmetsp:Transcript_9903/g.26951  ORF Transcript_9903/g.26951 Transcript_9903/m.26951 type:complete len:285 (-) Transcript_9903:2813-3667(-)